MPPKRAVEAVKSTEECILQIGKFNNIIKWRESMQTIVTELYGIVGMFFTTDVRYELPRTAIKYPEASASEDSTSESEDDLEADAARPLVPPEVRATYAAGKAARDAAREVRNERRRRSNDRSRAKYKEEDYLQRKRDLKAQKENERTIFPMMWKRMSTDSQSRVKEEDEYRTAYLTLDCVLLWTLIRRTHLTHMFGDTDPMKEINQHEQESKYGMMRQGERELITTFKARFDEQVLANDAVGVAKITDTLRALDFIGKLDQKRYRRMMTEMRNDALRQKPDAYPKSLAAAFRIASQWRSDGSSAMAPTPPGASAFVTEEVHVTGSKDTEKRAGKTGGVRKKTLTDIDCYACDGKGHYARNCPNKKPSSEKVHVSKAEPDSDDDSERDDWGVALVTASEMCMFSKYDILLDNEASLNIFSNKELLTGVRRAEQAIKVSGIQSGGGVTVDREGEFGEFGTVFYSGDASANILSFASQVDAGANIRYDHLNDCFTLQPKGSNNVYRFGRKTVPGSEGRFYSCDWRSVEAESAMVTTVEQNLRAFTKREIDRARSARELMARMGFPSVVTAMSIVNSGSNFDISARDFQVAESIWGRDVASLKGKTTKRATAAADMTINSKIVQKDQVLSIDIMFIDKIAILIGVATPLGLSMAYSLNNLVLKKSSRATEHVRKGIAHFLGVLGSQGFKTSVIMSDGEGAVVTLVDELGKLGVDVDISGAGGHVARIERKIRIIKERVRSHTAYHLPFTLSSVGIVMCVLYVVSRLNYEPYGEREYGPSPREAFIGRKPDGKRDFRCSFGDYVQCTVPKTDSSLKSRTEDCVVMLPLGNRTGTVRMLSLATGKLVNRDQFTILPMPESVIKKMNSLALADGRVKGKGDLEKINSTHGHISDITEDLPETMETQINEGVDPSTNLHDTNYNPELIYEEPVEQVDVAQLDEQHEEEIVYADDVISAVMPAERVRVEPRAVNMDDMMSSFRELAVGTPYTAPLDTADEHGVPEDYGENGAIDISAQEEQSIPATTPPTYSSYGHRVIPRADLMDMFRSDKHGTALLTRNYDSAGGDWGEFVLNISVNEALRTRGKDAETVIQKELSQMIAKKVWTPIDIRSLSYEEKRRIIRSSMFLKEKFLASGEFEKLKARLVAGGDQQDKTLYDDLSAPTVGISSVFTLLCIAAHEGRKVTVVDISGAYLNADMNTGLTVHMRLDKNMTGMMVKLSPEYAKYADSRGCVVVRLDKALYGCVESAALWYENLRESMRKLGYTPNAIDICVFNKLSEKGVQCTVAVHVDDLMITSTDSGMIESLATGLIQRYGDITRKDGPIVNYLGMVFDLTVGGVAKVTMTGYVDDMLREMGTSKGARTPATDGLFEVRPDALTVSEGLRVLFHRHVAKMLYLAKRARPDCLTAVAFLATRVTKCTVDDLAKLDRLMKYVWATRERGVMFAPGEKGIVVSVLIDAAYGVHADGRSHTGSCIVIGDSGAVHCKSSKQQIVTKSSTEAELVALSDSANQALYLRSFIMAQGHSCGPATIHQDNMSCMALIERGRSAAERTRHISIKYFWLKERVDTGEARVKHLGTKDMYANMLTKPLQGAQFKEERKGVTGWPDEDLA